VRNLGVTEEEARSRFGFFLEALTGRPAAARVRRQGLRSKLSTRRKLNGFGNREIRVALSSAWTSPLDAYPALP
jgi:hypothetical protein